MSSMNAAQAASSSNPVAVVARKKLSRTRVIILMAVPTDAREGSFTSPKETVKYLKCIQGVKGGFVQIFVRGHNPTRLIGQKIVAAVEVWKKTMANGEKYLYVDLWPLPDATEVTHRMSVMSVPIQQVIWQEGMVRFGTPAPRVGVIVLSSFDAKIALKKSAMPKMPKKPVAAPASVAPDNRTLAEKLAQAAAKKGWHVSGENA